MKDCHVNQIRRKGRAHVAQIKALLSRIADAPLALGTVDPEIGDVYLKLVTPVCDTLRQDVLKSLYIEALDGFLD